MLCQKCNIDFPDKDFMKGIKICFRCVYKEKSGIKLTKNSDFQGLCRNCKNPIIINSSTPYGRPRSIYCSRVCAKDGHIEQNKNYWTQKLKRQIPLR